MNNDETKFQQEDFFLPDICQTNSILFLVLITELLVFVLVLAESSLLNFNWARLGLTSIFVQWIVLSSAGVLCYFRPVLMRLSVVKATITGYIIIMSLTLAFSMAALWLTRESLLFAARL